MQSGQTLLPSNQSLMQNPRLSGLTITSVDAIRNSTYSKIGFSNGKTMQGETPYSTLPLYSYTVEFQDMKFDDALILECIPTRLPLNMSRLASLMGACWVEYDLEDLVYSPEKFDSSITAPDQTENLKTHYPELYAQLEARYEGVLYFHFDDVSLLPKIYSMDLVKQLTPTALRKVANMARNTPALLAFKPTLPSDLLPEISEKNFNDLVMSTGRTFTIGEKAAVMLYHTWLKGDILNNGHTYSLLSQASKHNVFWEEGLQFLEDNKLVLVEEKKRVFLTEVLQWEENIRKACVTLKERFEAVQGEVPLRNHETQPYTKRATLKTLTEEQQRALNVILSHPVAVLSGMAGIVAPLSWINRV
jgi:hypothetical protein